VAQPATVRAQETTRQDVSRVQKNPFADSVKVSLEFDSAFRIGPKDATGGNMNAQAVIPVPLSSDWVLITRSTLPVTYAPGPPDVFGSGDLQSSLFLSPTQTGDWTWGIGPVLQLPTASDDRLGTGKWSAGPTLGLVYVAGPWCNGVIVGQLWSLGGDPTREAVKQTSLEVLVSYTWESGWYVQTDPVMTRDWLAKPRDAWTIPVGLDAGKVFQLGSRSISVQVGAYDLAQRPRGSAEYVVRGQIQFAFPGPR